MTKPFLDRSNSDTVDLLRRSAPWVFVREFARRPNAVGSVWPSSSRLARQMAARVPAPGGRWVVQLGGGTGVLTQALLERGIGPERLIVVERSPVFARHLSKRFPRTQVVLGDAACLEQLLPPAVRAGSIVSSLPLLSLPRAEVSTILQQWHRVLPREGVAVQYTYNLGKVRLLGRNGFEIRDEDIIWRNLPPARIMVLSRQSG